MKVMLDTFHMNIEEDSIPDAIRLAAQRDPFQQGADYLLPCRYRQEPVATGAALGFISRFLDSV